MCIASTLSIAPIVYRRVRLFCSGYRAYANFASAISSLPYNTQTWRLPSLVLIGSEKYPYKGIKEDTEVPKSVAEYIAREWLPHKDMWIINHFANRGFSNGINAWTATDHTAYTVSTAGEAGFLQIFPIYVDQILYPTITKAGSTSALANPYSYSHSVSHPSRQHVNTQGYTYSPTYNPSSQSISTPSFSNRPSASAGRRFPLRGAPPRHWHTPGNSKCAYPGCTFTGFANFL